MLMLPGNTPNKSPFLFSAIDYEGRVLSATFNYDDTTRALLSGVLHRDAGCTYTKILIGWGADGHPESSSKTFDLSGFTGDRNFTATQLSHVGLDSIDDVLALQITAA